jgi:formylglycine-generating enzyme required for sulfatase activity
VEASENLDNWTQVNTGPIIGTGESLTYEAPISDLTPYQYFRLRAERLDPRLAPEAMGLVSIPGGTFQMNYLSPDNPGSTVTVSSFYMDPTETTYESWVEVRDWAEENGYTFDRPGEAGARLSAEFPEGHPVTTVNWLDVVKWANARSEMLGLQPVYYTSEDHSVVYREGRVHLLNTFVAWGANGFRLPTEAEWEYASRGGLENQIYPNGNSIMPHDANFDFDVIGRTPVNATTVVGSYPANGYNLYDMAGNVREWVWNNSSVFDPEGTTDPRGPDELPGFVQRILRGGAFNDGETQLQNRTRETAPATGAGDITGFRLVRQY